MYPRPPTSTRPYPLSPYPTLFRSSPCLVRGWLVSAAPRNIRRPVRLDAGRAPIGRRYNRAMSRPPDHDQEHDHGVAVEKGKPEVARPPLYSVLLLNDDYTPMDFVFDVLIRFFGMNLDKEIGRDHVCTQVPN